MKCKAVNYILLCYLFFLFTACSINKPLKYKELQDFGVKSATFNEILIKGNILFYNPNDIGAVVETENLSLWFKGKKLATANTETFKVAANSDFIIPITIKFPPEELIKDNPLGLLSNLLVTLNERSFEVNLKGTIILKKIGLKYSYKLNETKKIEF